MSASLFLPVLSPLAGLSTRRTLNIHPAVEKKLTPAMWVEIRRTRHHAERAIRWSSPWNHLLLLRAGQRTENRVVRHIEGFWRKDEDRNRYLALQQFLFLTNLLPFLLLAPIFLWVATFPIDRRIRVLETIALTCAMVAAILMAPVSIAMGLFATQWVSPWIWLLSISVIALGLLSWRVTRTLNNRWAPRLTILMLVGIGCVATILYNTADPERFRRSGTNTKTDFSLFV
jgi:hypothetical protein